MRWLLALTPKKSTYYARIAGILFTTVKFLLNNTFSFDMGFFPIICNNKNNKFYDALSIIFSKSSRGTAVIGLPVA